MFKILITLFSICLITISCANKETEDEVSSGFPVLSYSAEISETLNLDPANIVIDLPKEYIIGHNIF